jgi:polyhydroxyalkanoate synthase
MGHSLGGTFAAIFAAFAPASVRGLVLLGTPLSFEPGSSRFRDALVTILPPSFPAAAVISGAFLSHLVSVADPETFVWSRLLDAGLSMGHPWSAVVHARIERWALDELPLSGKLVQEILEWLYRENRFCGGTLSISNTTVGPASIRVPTFAVVNDADAIAPPASVRPFIDAMPKGKACLLQHMSEIGVGLPHFTILVGRQAHANVWPRIVSWLHAHA